MSRPALARPQVSRPPLRLLAVQLDGLDNEDGSARWFPCFTYGERWNGFATPYFERSVADEIVAAFNKRGGTQATYDGAVDAFIFVDEAGREEFKGVRIEGRILYPIGHSFWTWTDNASEN